jgi:hypothetical protein
MDFEYIKQFHLNPPTFALKGIKYMEDKYQTSKRQCENYEEDVYARLFPNPESNWCIFYQINIHIILRIRQDII